jgi:hypothetical protein
MRFRIAFLSLVVAVLACTLAPPEPRSEPAPVPTAQATVTVPVDDATPTVSVEPTGSPGWLTYRNEMIGYSFEYPPYAELTTSGVTGFPSEELPAGLDPGQYIATLEATYTEALCAGLRFPAAFFIVAAPDEKGGWYGGPCGVTGFGVYDLKREDAPIVIDGEEATLKTTRVYEVGNDTLVDEVAAVRLADGTLISFGSAWEEAGLTYEDYVADRAIILQVMATYRRLP